MKFLDPLLVDGSVLDRYLSRLAENTAQVLSRLEACEQRSELLREELEQVKSSSIQAYKKVDDYENRLTAIQKQLDSRKKSPDSLEQVKSSSIQADKKVDDHEKRLAAIQKKLDSGGGSRFLTQSLRHMDYQEGSDRGEFLQRLFEVES